MLRSPIELKKRAQDTLRNRLKISVLDEPLESTESESETESDAQFESDSVVIDANPSSTSSSGFYKFAQKYELLRKLFHSSTGAFTIWLYAHGYNQKQLVIPLIVLALICFLQDFIRFRNPAFNSWFIKTYGFMMRDSERDKYNGILFFLMGIILTSGFLPKDLAFVCNLLLSWADTSALFLGRMYGRYTPKIPFARSKSLAGCMASFATGVISCYLVYGLLIPKYGSAVDLPGEIFYNSETSTLNLHFFAGLTGIIASFSECVNIYEIDDNFTIPVISGIFLYILVAFTNI